MGRTTCIFKGHVQGVGFRYTTLNIAQSYDVTGFVRNTSEGHVELVIEGPAGQRQAMITALKEHMADFIHQTIETQSPGTGEYQRFAIRH